MQKRKSVGKECLLKDLSASVDSFLSASSLVAEIVVDSASGDSRADSSSTILTKCVFSQSHFYKSITSDVPYGFGSAVQIGHDYSSKYINQQNMA